MKRIGILTLPLNNNYGGTLQAFALYQFLKSNNYDVHLIQKETYRPEWKRLLIRALEKTPFQDIKKYRSSAIKNKFHRPFIDKYIPQRTKKSFTTSELESASSDKNFDAVIVGSDQVWRLDYIDDGHCNNYFLDFVKSSKTLKISYAASFGKDTWQDAGKYEEIKTLLQQFDAVSSREVSGVDICINYFNLDQCTHVLDPTLMVDKQIYNQFLSPIAASQTKKLLIYILDHNAQKNSIASELCNSLGESCQPVFIYDDDSHTPKYDAAGWVNLFATSDFIVTDSFHGMVFSIIFNKQFVVIGNKDRGLARFSSLLNMLGLESRLITSEDEYKTQEILNNPIDYTLVEPKLSDLKHRSQAFLTSSLLKSK